MPESPQVKVSRTTIREEFKLDESSTGKLLQIHPLDIQTGLVEIDQNPFIIGRDDDCSLTIPESSVSRQHARIDETEAGYVLSDLGSTNGTWVNKKSASRALLDSGDRIRVGSRIFKFLVSDEIEEQYYDAIYSMMTKDSLTGAWNKRIFLEMLARELKLRQRSKNSVSLLMMDMDHFKSINDCYGHVIGDEVLVELANRIRKNSREEDLFARFGGEEFAVVLGDTPLEQAVKVAERWRSAVADVPFETKAGPINCTMSVGLAVASEDRPFVTPIDLVRLADEKLYEAKAAGRNRVCF